jgi:type IV pilus assembly protein PilA
MFCYRCGSSMPDTATACPQCGAAVQQASQPVPPPAASTPIPSTPQSAGYQPGVAPALAPYSGQQESEGKATASMVLGILSLVFFGCFGVLAGIPAVILGHIAKSNIRKSGGRLTGDGKATAGLVMGYISIALLPFVLIIAAIAIPSLLRARIAANESAAAITVRTINTGQASYSTSYPTAGYAPDLATLGPGPTGTCPGEGTQDHACLLDNRLGNSRCTVGRWCVRDAYQYSLMAFNCGAQGCTDYVVVGKPVRDGSTGNKSYCSTSDAVVRWRIGAVRSIPTVEECQSWSPV